MPEEVKHICVDCKNVICVEKLVRGLYTPVDVYLKFNYCTITGQDVNLEKIKSCTKFRRFDE